MDQEWMQYLSFYFFGICLGWLFFPDFIKYFFSVLVKECKYFIQESFLIKLLLSSPSPKPSPYTTPSTKYQSLGLTLHCWTPGLVIILKSLSISICWNLKTKYMSVCLSAHLSVRHKLISIFRTLAQIFK